MDERAFGPSYPLGFFVKTCVAMVFACSVGLFLVRLVFSGEAGGGSNAAFHDAQEFASLLLPGLVSCAFVTQAVGAVAMFAIALFTSHRVAGPLLRLQRVAAQLQSKEAIGHIHLRTGDLAKPVASALNDWGTARDRKLADLRQGIARCQRSLRACEQAVAEDAEVPIRAEALLGDLGALGCK